MDTLRITPSARLEPFRIEVAQNAPSWAVSRKIAEATRTVKYMSRFARLAIGLRRNRRKFLIFGFWRVYS